VSRLRVLVQGGARPFTAIAVSFAIFGCLMLLVQLVAPSTSLYWTGRPVQGVNDGGIVYYHVHGQEYTGDVPDSSGPGSPEPPTAFVDRNDPSTALPDRWTRWLDYSLVAVWFVAAPILVLLGQRRRRRRQPNQRDLSLRLGSPVETRHAP